MARETSNLDTMLARVRAKLPAGADLRLSEREQIELLDALEPANRDALLHAVRRRRVEGWLPEKRVDEIARTRRADGWAVLCGLGFVPPWDKLPQQQRIALRLAGTVLTDLQ